SNQLGNPANMVDWLVMLDTPETLSPGTRKGINLVMESPPRLEMVEPGNHDYPRRGEWISEEDETEFEFTEFIPSWNVNAPKETGVRFDVKTRDARSGEWSPWIFIGQWGKVVTSEKKLEVFEGGRISIDTLVLKYPA